MAIDIRASVTCSLGLPLISASINDDYVQGTGLIKCRGTCELSGIATPAIGTAVTFSYTQNGVTRQVPRKLRVLSSFADPFRRTTSISLGCKLTYLENLKEQVDWTAFDDPANASYTSTDANIITIPISASSVMAQCLTKLGITASSSPLTNKFSITKFDLSPGYVSVLSDLLVSESYCGYLDTSEVLQVFSLDQSGGTGPVIDSTEIIDLGPINVGQLPGEAVTVSYSTLKLQQPDNASSAEATAIRNWERSESVVGPNTYYVGQRIFYGSEQTVTVTSYQRINGKDVPVRRETAEIGSTAKIAGSIGTAYEKNGISFNAIETELRKTVEVSSYDTLGNLTQTVATVYDQALAIYGGISLDYVRSTSDFVSFNYGLIARETAVTEYLRSSSTEQEVTRSYKLWPLTIQGQQAIAEQRDSLTTSAAVSNFINSVSQAGLVYESTVVQLSTVSETLGRPSDYLNASYADGGDPNNGWRTESKAELELALGSATAQRRIELSMPYAPDDTFYKSGGGYYAQQSDAAEKARRYGRCQNRLLLGNRSGMNVQVAAPVLPSEPFAPVVIQANGLSALFRTNGTSWQMDSSGILASTDALFWGAVGGTGTFWFPVAPTVTTLPTTPPVVDGQMTVSTVVPVWNETAVTVARTRTKLSVLSLAYALAGQTAVTVTSRTKLVAASTLT